MKRIVCAVYDDVTELFGPPVLFVNAGHAFRGFVDMVNSGSDEMLKRNPDDFSFYKLGLYDDTTGVFENQNERLARAQDVKEN